MIGFRLAPMGGKALALAVCAAFSSCASYTPAPLPNTDDLASSLAALKHDGTDVTGPLKLADVELLAVENNPDLRATRAQRGLARAQVIEAGILPNPQIYAFAMPTVAGAGTTTAYNIGITADLKSLVTLSLHKQAARDTADQVDAQILWQEWQMVGQARLLVVDLLEGARSQKLLDRTRDLLARRSAHGQQALAAGNATLATTAPDLAALQTARTAADDMQRQQMGRRHQLNALLGLAPEVDVPLDDRLEFPVIDQSGIPTLLAGIGSRRPDLAALRLGYSAQDAKLRAGILAQFPNISFGVIGGSDNSNIRSFGPQLTIDLPIFDRGQGKIAIESATRQQLHEEYTARLDAAAGQIRAMLRERALLEAQRDRVRNDLPATRRAAQAATSALAARDIDERSYLDLVTSETAKELEIVTIEQALLDQRVALATLVGAGLPPITQPQDAAATAGTDR